MIPMQLLPLEKKHDKDSKHRQRDYFLYDLKLKKVKRTAIGQKAISVGRNHKCIFQQRNTPRAEYNPYQRG